MMTMMMMMLVMTMTMTMIMMMMTTMMLIMLTMVTVIMKMTVMTMMLILVVMMTMLELTLILPSLHYRITLQIPYTLSDNLSKNDRLTIAKAMDQIEEDTCVKFVPRGLNPYYVHIGKGSKISPL